MPALENEPCGRDDGIGALFAGKLGTFFDAIEGHLTGAPENAEDGAVLHMIDGIIAPLAGGDTTAIGRQNGIKLCPIEADILVPRRAPKAHGVKALGNGFYCHTRAMIPFFPSFGKASINASGTGKCRRRFR